MELFKSMLAKMPKSSLLARIVPGNFLPLDRIYTKKIHENRPEDCTLNPRFTKE